MAVCPTDGMRGHPALGGAEPIEQYSARQRN